MEIPEEVEGLNRLEWAKFRDHFYEVRGRLSTAEEFDKYERVNERDKYALDQMRLCFRRVPDEVSEEELQNNHIKNI